MTGWRALPLDADDERRLARALEDLPTRLAAEPTVGFSLADGAAASALAAAYVAVVAGDDSWFDRAVAFAGDALENAVDTSNEAGLFEGVAGPAWLLAHLDGWVLDLEGDDPGDAVEGALLALVRDRPWDGPYDLVAGLVGFGAYGLERGPRGEPLVAAVVDRLGDLSIETDDGVTWHTAAPLLPDHQRAEADVGYFNVGLAHGVPGVVGLLAASRADDVLLDGAVRWVLAQRLDGDRFPRWVGSGTTVQPARDAWCYGGPGIAAVVAGAGVARGRTDWLAAAVDIAVGSLDRSPDDAGITGAGLCHGAAGLLHIANRLWQATGDERLLHLAVRWLRSTIDLAPMITEPGLMEGWAGVALALSAAAGIEPAWDRLFLLS